MTEDLVENERDTVVRVNSSHCHSKLLFNIENPVLRARSEFNGFTIKKGFRFQPFLILSLTPDTRNLKPIALTPDT
jgi:hypothetical protein